ncbi:pH-response regulator protein [Scheffersomyces stipitis CBS 6054]|uniref:pH-response regulator protein palF/RIM8 n=1 Tax=Scheffersomyces stipitis (strain ATCC 58785 / CBS 6054 / NBRC 10063 / NRRL Y-11545) TaxID=322104 RepID=A3GFB2_PICST|nr:pH-response regulator protein [Scheffersomyces stipitis CBS 6054]EAZ63725.2 pH-response regulator protein [Scheffersomyces stipitis CBS 6054]
MRRAVSKIIPTPKFLSGSTEPLHSSNFRIDFNSVADFYIQLDKPHKTWLPGDEVPGKIILISKKNLANIVITLSLIGYVKINASSHSKLRPIKHSLFDHTIKIYGDGLSPEASGSVSEADFTNGLYKGEHVFPFIVKLPNKRVFTSIDFGKGSISYILRASLGNSSSYTTTGASTTSISTSSNSIQPTSSIFAKTKSLKILQNPSYTSEKLIHLVNPIDVTTLTPPKPKRLILKDPRTQHSKKLSRTQSSTSTINTINTINTYSTVSSNNSDTYEAPNATGTNTNGSNNPSPKPNVVLPGLDKSSIKPETIKVCLEIPQRGYLRGELIPIKLSISHLKKIQDLHGIIITLVRVCRLDNGTESFFESFRKDLQQSVLPIFVDPVTFQSEINTSVRVPADAFPTISGCPLVSFQYFIEVLVNLSGKSLVLDNDAPTDHHSATKIVDDPTTFNFNYNNSLSSQHHKDRSGFINTDKYKRSKKFLQLTTEVIIGTHRSTSDTNTGAGENAQIDLSRRSSSSISNPNNSPPNINNNSNRQASYINAIPEAVEMNNFQSPPYFENLNQSQGHSQTRQFTPLPTNFSSIPNYSELSGSGSNAMGGSISEKERLRLLESSLLPSAPPMEQEDDNTNNNSNNSQYQFFTYQNSSTATSQMAENNDEQYDAIDFVPNYNSASNDRLLAEGRQAGTGAASTLTRESGSDSASHA